MRYRIIEIEGIGAVYSAKLAEAGIKSTDDLLAKCGDRKGRKKMADATGLTEHQLLKWANLADLMRINGIGTQYSELLEAAGVDTIKELRNRKADNLTEKIAEVHAAKKLTRAKPARSMVERWIAEAKSMEPAITH